ENKVRTATVMSRIAHAAGYGGYGAVMGSKRLKAILVKGNNPLPRVHDHYKWIELRDRAIELLKDRLARFRQWGTTTGTWYHGYSTSSIPIKNWQEEFHSRVDFSPAGFESKVWVKNPWADHGCPVGCMKLSRVIGDNQYHITDGPDYEMAAYLGANLGIFNPVDVTKLSSIADDLGLCGIQTGNVIGFAMELYQRGILRRDDIGYNLAWGDANTVERLLYDIAYRRGIGNQLAEGTYRFAKAIEKTKNINALKYAVQVKGVGVGAHGIRSGKDYPQVIAYACSVQGGDHTSVAGLPAKSTESESWIAILDSGVICLFLDLGDQFIMEYLDAVTGWDLDLNRLYDIGNRILTLQRILLLLGGPDIQWNSLMDDENPDRFYEPLPNGPYSGLRVDRDKVAEARREYYRQLGWDDNGIPRKETLERLELTEFEYLVDKILEVSS
ncbi:MAG: aldehyde ferredoxin oxidoreductase C-terminal domain-containing protein, partial [Desulfurococcaceae archaeon]